MKLTLTYRKFNEYDYNSVLRLVESAEDLFFMFPKAVFPLTKEQLKQNIKNRKDSTVILANNQIIGFANFYEVEDGLFCSIGNVIIDLDFRGQNIGQYLIETMEQIALSKYNISEVHLSCFNTNTRGILLYNRLGYLPHRVEKRLDKNNNPIALIHMTKKL